MNSQPYTDCSFLQTKHSYSSFTLSFLHSVQQHKQSPPGKADMDSHSKRYFSWVLFCEFIIL